MADKIDANQIPPAVKEAFTKKFPGAEVKKWEVEAAYEAEFKQNGRRVEANFYPNGSLAQVEYQMEVDDLPQAVKQAVLATYPHCEMDEAERVEKADGQIVYELGLTFEIHMTPDGKLVAVGKDL